MDIQIDSREKPKAIGKILKCFDENNVSYYVSKLYVGDYMNLDNPRLIIDRKQNLNEICGNVCQGHSQLINELIRARGAGIKIIYLIEHGCGICRLENVKGWQNPRLRVSPKAMTGERLYKALLTISDKYDTQFLFCSKGETGSRIIELLDGVGADE